MCATDIRPAASSQRLVLRGPVAADAAPIAELANDLGVAGMTPSLPYPFSQADAEACLSRAVRADPQANATFVIEHRQFGVIGMLALREDAPRRPQLGLWVGRPFWGRGYGTEAVGAALGWARSDWRRNVVWAGHFADNPAAGQVLVKAGFLYTGDVARTPCVARGGETASTRMMVWLA